MAMKPQATLPEDQQVPPGSTPDNGNAEAEQEIEAAEEEQEAAEEPATGPEEGEPETEKPEAEQEPEPDPDAFDPDPQFEEKFKGKDGRIDWKKVHDSYLEAEKALHAPKKVEPSADELRIQQEAEFGRYTAYLVQKYPNLTVQQAHQKEQQEQVRQQQRQQQTQGEFIPEVEELTDEEVDEQVNSLIAEGKHAQAQRLAARHTPEAKLVRRNEKLKAERERAELQRTLEEQRTKLQSDLASVQSKYGDQPPHIWTKMREALAKVPPKFEVDVEDLFLLVKSKEDKKAKPAVKAPPGRTPRPGAQPVKPVRKAPPVGGQTDDEYLSGRRDISLNDLLGKKQ